MIVADKKATIVEIGPRDGFQSIKEFIPTELKLEIIEGLVKSGIKKIQCTSFVSPKAIPQMRDAEQIVKIALEKYPDVKFFALIPNFHGANAAVQAGLKEVSLVISLSLSHNQANIRRTHEESIAELKKIRQQFPELIIDLDIATTFGCPFEGKMEVPPLVDLLGKIYDTGIRVFTLCDTIGVAHPQQVTTVMKAAKEAFSDCVFNLHIHDTRNMGIINSYVGIQHGAESVQTAIGGLGGCPFAPGASGNTSTEDLIYMLEKDGYDTGVNFPVLLETARKLRENVKGNYSGHHISLTHSHS